MYEDGGEKLLEYGHDVVNCIGNSMGVEIELVFNHTRNPNTGPGGENPNAITWYPHGTYGFGTNLPSYEDHRNLTDQQTDALVLDIRGQWPNNLRNMADGPTQQQRVDAQNHNDTPHALIARADIETSTEINASRRFSESVAAGFKRRPAEFEQYRNMLVVEHHLQATLPPGVTIGNIMPNRRTRVGNEPVPGHTLNAAQKTALSFQLRKDAEQGGEFIGDAPGTGKTTMMMANTIAGNAITAAASNRTILPTLIIVPAPLVAPTVDIFHDQMGVDYNVWRYGDHLQKPKSNTRYNVKPESEAFQRCRNRPICNNIIVMSYYQLSHMNDDEAAALVGQFERIHADEAGALRYAEMRKHGRKLKAFNAPFLWLYSGTPLVNSLNDIRGYLALLEKPEVKTKVNANQPVPPGCPRSNSISVSKRFTHTNGQSSLNGWFTKLLS